jgi:hypothetical protein
MLSSECGVKTEDIGFDSALRIPRSEFLPWKCEMLSSECGVKTEDIGFDSALRIPRSEFLPCLASFNGEAAGF